MSDVHGEQMASVAGAGKTSRFVFLIVTVAVTVVMLLMVKGRVASLTFTQEEVAERQKAAEEAAKKASRRRRPAKKQEKKEEAKKAPSRFKNLAPIKLVVRKPPEEWLYPLMAALATVTILVGVFVAALLKLFGFHRAPCKPVQNEGHLTAPNMERAVETVVTRCRRMGFDPEVKVGLQEGDVDPEAKGALSFVEHTTVRGFAAGRMGAIGPEEHDHAVEVKIDLEGERFHLLATAYFPDTQGKDRGETEYCREVVSKLLDRKVDVPGAPSASFVACLALAYGIMACLPIIFSPMHLGKYQCLGWTFLATSAGMALLFGLLGILRIIIARRRLHGLAAAVGGPLLAVVSVLVALTVDKLVIVQ